MKKKKEKLPNSILCLLGLSRSENQILVPPRGSQDCWVQATKMELKASWSSWGGWIGAERLSAATLLTLWACRFFVMRLSAALRVLAELFWADAQRTSLLTVIIEDGSEETKCPSEAKWLLEVTDKSLYWSSSKRENLHSQEKDTRAGLYSTHSATPRQLW